MQSVTSFIFALLILGGTIVSAQEIAITFDDAPTSDGPHFTGKERTQKIIAHLKQQKVEQVAFFVITGNVDRGGRERLQQYFNAGHLLANHTKSHESIQSMGVRGYCNDIRQADSLLRNMQGFTPWFRYPFLDEGKSKPVRDSIRSVLKDLSLSNGYVTIDNYDWYINGLLKKAIAEGRKINYDELRSVYIEHIWNSIVFYDQIGQRVLGRSPRHVLLLHENDLAAYFISDLIKHLKDKGWKIISPVKAYQDPIATHIPDVLFNGQGRVAAIAREKDIPARELIQEAEDEAYLDELVKTRKVFE
jgi:peptidoglycan/xylan/chitin deacetylase (PgdA/CDA1 family)